MRSGRWWLWILLVLLALGFVVGLGLARAEDRLYSDGWQPPRLVAGLWITSGVTDEQAAQISAETYPGQTPEQIQQIEWQTYWRHHWQEPEAPPWAQVRGAAPQSTPFTGSRIQLYLLTHSMSSMVTPGPANTHWRIRDTQIDFLAPDLPRGLARSLHTLNDSVYHLESLTESFQHRR